MADKLTQKSQVFKGLNAQQEKAVTFGNGPLLIIAGAGTGKTTVLTRRIVWLMEQALAKPEEILALTFTEKAANEMVERVDMLLPLGYSDINISTFHAFAQKILSQHALDIGLPGDFKVITDTQAWMLIKKHLYDFDLDYYKPVGNPNKFIHALLKHFNKAKGEEITPEDYLKYAEGLRLAGDSVEVKKKARKRRKGSKGVEVNGEVDLTEAARILEVANAYHKYQKLLLDNGYLDFGDLINYTLKFFRERPKILERYQKQYQYILVDEFQDTDLSQYNLVKLLSHPENNITVVGDDDQSIYKFRGASVSNILKFKEDYPKASEVTLVENYRSTQNILDLSYDFIKLNNPERLEAKLKISKKLKSCLKDKGLIEVIHAGSGYEEARRVTDKIIELTEKDKLTFNDFAILARANDHSEAFIAELSRRNIPYIFVANRGLYKKPLILDILAYLRLLDNYHESDNLFRVLNFRKFKIADGDIIDLTQTAKKKTLSLYEVVKNHRSLVHVAKQSEDKMDELLRLLTKHSTLAREMPVSELLVRILTDLDITKNLAEDSAENVERRSLLEQFYRKTQKHEEENDDNTLKGFMGMLKLELEAGDQGELASNAEMGPEAVKIMTIHASKGLEFSCVFVVNMVDQRFPSRERKETIEIPEKLVKEILPEGDAHLMEERRLFYVAATRAKKFLFLTWADDYGGTQNKKPSRFLVELGLEEKAKKVGPSGEVFFPKAEAPAKSAPKLAIPDTFSFSHISCFLHCPLEYKYKYIYHLPLPGEAQLSFGVTIHKTLEKYLNALIQLNAAGNQPDLFGPKKAGAIKLPPKELLFKYYQESWVDDWFADKIQKEDYRKRGVVYLENFYQKFSENPRLPKFLEKPFKLKLGQYKFTGKIDRGDTNPEGTINIVDYKTGEPKPKLSPVDKQQLLIYQWAASEQFGEKVKSLNYWYLQSLGDSGEFIGSLDDLKEVQNKLLEVIGEIIETTKTGSFLEADLRTSHGLGGCKYRHLENSDNVV